MKVTVIGAGFVGLVTAACLSRNGHQVRCIEAAGQQRAMAGGTDQNFAFADASEGGGNGDGPAALRADGDARLLSAVSDQPSAYLTAKLFRPVGRHSQKNSQSANKVEASA